MVKNFPEWVTAQSSVSRVVGLLPLSSGPACSGMTFPPFLVKQLYRWDSVVISSFVRTGYTTRGWGWLLGRIGYSITDHCPLYIRRITAAEMKYMRTAWYTWTDYKTKNAQIAKELKISPILDKLLEYKRSSIQHINRMPRNKLPRVMKYYSPTGRRNHGRPLKRLPETWDREGSTSGPTPWQIYIYICIYIYMYIYIYDDDDDIYRLSA